MGSTPATPTLVRGHLPNAVSGLCRVYSSGVAATAMTLTHRPCPFPSRWPFSPSFREPSPQAHVQGARSEAQVSWMSCTGAQEVPRRDERSDPGAVHCRLRGWALLPRARRFRERRSGTGILPALLEQLDLFDGNARSADAQYCTTAKGSPGELFLGPLGRLIGEVTDAQAAPARRHRSRPTCTQPATVPVPAL